MLTEATPINAATTMPAICIAGVLSCMPFGVSLLTLMLGGLCFFAGCCARIGMSLYRRLEGPGEVSSKDFSRAIAMLLCTTPLAAVASCVVFLAARVMNIQADAAFGGLLLVVGVRGPEGFQWLMDNLSAVFTRFLPGKKPDAAAP